MRIILHIHSNIETYLFFPKHGFQALCIFQNVSNKIWFLNHLEHSNNWIFLNLAHFKDIAPFLNYPKYYTSDSKVSSIWLVDTGYLLSQIYLQECRANIENLQRFRVQSIFYHTLLLAPLFSLVYTDAHNIIHLPYSIYTVCPNNDFFFQRRIAPTKIIRF